MRTLRGRLFAYLAISAFVASLLTALVAGFLTRQQVERQIKENLDRQASVVATAVQGAGAAALPQLRVFFARQGEILVAPGALLGQGLALRNAVIATGETSGKVTVLGRDFLFAVADTGTGPIVLARPTRLLFDDWEPFLPILVASGLGGALVAAVLAYALARRISGPVARVSEAAGRLAAGGGDVRVPVEGRDELAGLAESFNRMAGDLDAARASERAFLLSASHELKTPLTAIRGYAEAIADGASDPREAGAVIGKEAERLERLVQDLLDLARLDQQRFSVRQEPVDLNEVAHAVWERYAARAAEFGVELDLQTHDGAHATADRDRLLQVVSNLVENALRVTPIRGRVTVRTDGSSIAVDDTGPGLEAEDLPRAFERFYLHDRYRGDRSVGSGLGLAIVRELTDAMGGRAGVRSSPGGGTSFWLDLPA